MDSLVSFCSECSSLATLQLKSTDSTLRLRCLCAVFIGMKDNVVRVQQGVANNTCTVTNQMTQWTSEIVNEARTLIKTLKEEPRELNFFEKRFISFCVSLEKNDEHIERLDSRLHTLLCRAFLIQIAIYCEEQSIVVDVMRGTTAQSARQEFLGCVFDLKQRIAASAEHSDQVYKQLVFQLSEEYQNRQDERTVAGKRAFIRWHKAANDMIKSQLQQKLTERERALQAKNEEIQTLTVELEKHRTESLQTKSQLESQQLAAQKQATTELEAEMREKAELKQKLEGKAKIETELQSQQERVSQLDKQIAEKNAEIEKSKSEVEGARKENTALNSQISTLQVNIDTTRKQQEKNEKELTELRQSVKASNEKLANAVKQSQQQAAEIKDLKDKLKAAEEAPVQNGIVEELAALKQQLKDSEARKKELEDRVLSIRKENGSLKEQVRAKQNENTTITQSISRKVEEIAQLKAENKSKDASLKNFEHEIKTLREQVKENQAKHLEVLERNVEIEEVSKTLQEQITQKEQEIMDLENRFASLEDEMKREISDKTESIESLERTIKRLNTSLENTKRDLQAKKEALRELQS